MSFTQSTKRSLSGRIANSLALASASAFVDKSYKCASSITPFSSEATFVRSAKFLDSVNDAWFRVSSTLFSSRTASGMTWANARNSIATPSAMPVINCSSLRRWARSWPSFAEFKNKYHSPPHPTATIPAAKISQQVQNQNDGSAKKQNTVIEIVTIIAQIAFGILIFTGVCFFLENYLLPFRHSRAPFCDSTDGLDCTERGRLTGGLAGPPPGARQSRTFSWSVAKVPPGVQPVRSSADGC